MSHVYRFLVSVSWALGFLSLIVAVLLRLIPALAMKTTFTPRGGIVIAGTLFLGALASAEMRKMSSSAAPPASGK